MGNIIKINMYVEKKKRKNHKLRFDKMEKNISEYNEWLKKTKGEDKIETYEKFLQVK